MPSKKRKKKKTKVQKIRNWLAVHAHFRKAWVERSKKKQESKDSCRKWKKGDDE